MSNPSSFAHKLASGVPIQMGRNTMAIYVAILAGCNRGIQPSVRELAAIIGSRWNSAAHVHIRKLVKLGLLKWPDGSLSRAITPLYRAEFYVGDDHAT